MLKIGHPTLDWLETTNAEDARAARYAREARAADLAYVRAKLVTQAARRKQRWRKLLAIVF